VILSATGRIDDLTINDRTTHALLTSVHMHLLLSIVDPIPALHPVAAVLDVSLYCHSRNHRPQSRDRRPDQHTSTSSSVETNPFRQGSPRPPIPPPRRDQENDVWVPRESAGRDPTTTLAHPPVGSGAPGYPTLSCTKSLAP